MPNPIVHWEIVSPENGKRLQEFYGGLFGWKMDTNNPYEYGVTETETNGRGINGGIGATEGPGRVTIYAEVDDLQACLDKAVSLGGTVAMEPTEIPGAVTMAMFTDPAGNFFGLVKSGSMQTQG
ncbi:MAG: hypothetical protein OJF49_004438 [Ktedonobacterales bacterium]|nr:MAG: hypothetical protein OJF49_004438 [Ktedonobacterales bacterium]